MENTMTPDDYVNGAKAATGLFMASVMDGSVSELTDDEATRVTAMASTVPAVAGEALGIPPADAEAFGPAAIQQSMLGAFYDSIAIGMMTDAEEKQAAVVDSMKARRQEAAFRYCGMTDQDVARVEQDAQLGDMSAMISAKERFYLG